MIPNPILKVLSSIQRNHVRALLMGGQACVLYGAAEFSRDTDLAILASPVNLNKLRFALGDLQAAVIAVPPFELNYLRKGHAVHFRCHAEEAAGMRIDVLTKMRGVDAFPVLWRSRTTISLPDGTNCDLISLPDLVQAKKTQRDKAWPMIRRLVEANYFENRDQPTRAQLRFWFQELRTPELLIELSQKEPRIAKSLLSKRLLLKHARNENETALADALLQEEMTERKADRKYWAPLKKELEQLRLAKARRPKLH